MYPYSKNRVLMILKQINEDKLLKKVKLSERPFISEYFLLFVPTYFLIYVSKVRTI